MSLPHTGQLEAIVSGHLLRFDGEVWSGENTSLVSKLNELDHTRMNHDTIDIVAREMLKLTGLAGEAEIVSVKADTWRAELPPGAVD